MHSNYWRNKVMEALYCSTTYSFYLGLSSTSCSIDGTGITEPTGNGYKRVHIDSFSSSGDGSIYNTRVLTFPKSTEVWFPPSSPATHWVIFDGPDDNANILSCDLLSSPTVVGANTIVTLPANTVLISFV